MLKTLIYLFLSAGLIALFFLLAKKKKTKRFGIAVVLLALLIEVFVFNFHSFHLLFGSYESVTYTAESEGISYKSASDGKSASLTVYDLGKKVGTLHLSCKLDEKTSSVNVKLSATDETYSQYFRSNVAKGTVIAGDAKSEYITINLSGKVGQVKIDLSSEGTFTFEKMTFNEPIPMIFEPVRLLLFVGALMALYALFTFPSMKASYAENKLFFKKVLGFMTIVFLSLAILITEVCNFNANASTGADFKMKTGNQITKELVDAFEHGQVSLLDEPSEDLLALENPYDWSERTAKKVSAKWDHLLYNGKYYSYYGIAPVFLLFLPYHLITGFYFPTNAAVLLFGMAGILFLAFLFLEVVKRFGQKIPNAILISTFAVLELSSGVWYNFCSPLFYEIAQASGFAFTCAGLYFLLHANLIGEGKIKLPSVALAATFLGLAVLCRPTLALYCVVSLIFLGYGLFKKLAEAKAKKVTKAKKLLPFLACALVPYIILGGGQMLYNFARFGSFFDFGIEYSLTINDFTRSQYATDFVMIGLFNFLFAAPKYSTVFPFVGSNFSDLNVNGYYYIANRNAIGLFFRALPMWGYLGIVPAWKSLSKKERRDLLLLGLPVCVIAPVIIICSIWESGYGVRYSADFAIELILGGALLLWLLYQKMADGQGKKLLSNLFPLFACVALVFNFAMLYEYLPKDGHLASQYLSFENLFRII